MGAEVGVAAGAARESGFAIATAAAAVSEGAAIAGSETEAMVWIAVSVGMTVGAVGAAETESVA